MILLLILASVVCAVGLGTGMVVALGRIGADADEDLDRLLDQNRPAPPLPTFRQSYAELATAQSAISCEPSTTVQLHETVSVPSIPAWRWPGTEQ